VSTLGSSKNSRIKEILGYVQCWLAVSMYDMVRYNRSIWRVIFSVHAPSTLTAAGGGARVRKTRPRMCCPRSAQTLRKVFAIYGSETAEVVPGRTSWLVVEVRPVRSAGFASLSCPNLSSALAYTCPRRPSFDFCTRIATTGAEFVRQLTNASSRQTLSFAALCFPEADCFREASCIANLQRSWNKLPAHQSLHS
jgi:hypothetical protein